jgi:hypothetical protein
LQGISYIAAIDAASGSGSDSFTAAISFHDSVTDKAVLAATREFRPPFAPGQVIEELAPFFNSYGIGKVWADRYAKGFVAEHLAKHGLVYAEFNDKDEKYIDKSGIYREFLPRINSGKVELRDNPRIVAQCCALERTVARGSSKDTIDHPRGSHDDLINAVAAALVLAASSMNKAEQWARFNRNAPVSVVPNNSLPMSAYAFAAERQQRNGF